VTARKFTDTASREYKQRILPALNQLEQGIVKRDRRAVQAASKKLKQAQVQKQSNQLAAALGATKCAGT
jgi:23S rRNA maturation mini-RNase III